MTDEQNLIKEVNEEIKQDEYKKLWNKYGNYLIGLIVMVILFVSSETFYKNYKIKKYQKQSELFFEAAEYIDNEQYQKAEKILLEVSDFNDGGYSDLSTLILIDLKSQNKISANLKNSKINNKFLQDYLILQKFNSQLNTENNEIFIDEIVKISNTNSLFRFTAHELLASYYIKENDVNRAIQSLTFIVEEKKSPIYMKERAELLIKRFKKNQ